MTTTHDGDIYEKQAKTRPQFILSYKKISYFIQISSDSYTINSILLTISPLAFKHRSYRERSRNHRMSRATSIQKVLDDLYPNPPAPLDHCNDFTFLVAVILSAQTTDGAVNSVTKELFRLAPEPVLLAKMPHAQVLKIIQTVGLAPKKSQYIIDTAKALVEKFGGRVPSTLEELITLPGVGRKTAAVVLSQIHGVPALAVDTHVHRYYLRCYVDLLNSAFIIH